MGSELEMSSNSRSVLPGQETLRGKHGEPLTQLSYNTNGIHGVEKADSGPRR